MNIITWNILGLNIPHKTKILTRKIQTERLVVICVQETKCSEHRLLETWRKAWRNYEGVGIYAYREVWGLVILCNPEKISLAGFLSSQTSLLVEFHVVGTSIRGVMTNVYGPHTTTQKVGFIKTLWKINQGVEGRHWILGGYFNMITSLEGKKGRRRRMDGEIVIFR